MSSQCLLRKDKEKVLIKWEAISKERFPSANDLTRTAVRDHLPELVDALCEVIETKNFAPPKEISKIHGRQRFAFGDYTLSQVIGEYSILKNLVFDQLDLNGSESQATIRLIDLFFDSAITTAATEFTKLREQELSLSANRLEESVTDLERFAGVAAHDLRSPAATIVSYSELLIEDLGENASALNSAETVNRTAKRMIELIDQLLIYTRIGKSELKFREFSLLASFEDAVSSSESFIRNAHAQIHTGLDFKLYGDSILFTQLFQNLIANSVKFRSPARVCEIWASAKLNDKILVIEFKDNGLGFSAALSEMIFEPFKRAHEHLKIQGSGIGLATVLRIVKLHNGSIRAVSTEGVGATFVIEVPIVENVNS